jgi:hypothetical protein
LEKLIRFAPASEDRGIRQASGGVTVCSGSLESSEIFLHHFEIQLVSGAGEEG